MSLAYEEQLDRGKPPTLPPARALREGSRLAPGIPGPTLARRWSYVSRRLRPVGIVALTYFIGFFPLIMVVALAIGLAWGSAIGNGP